MCWPQAVPDNPHLLDFQALRADTTSVLQNWALFSQGLRQSADDSNFYLTQGYLPLWAVGWTPSSFWRGQLMNLVVASQLLAWSPDRAWFHVAQLNSLFQ